MVNDLLDLGRIGTGKLQNRAASAAARAGGRRARWIWRGRPPRRRESRSSPSSTPELGQMRARPGSPAASRRQSALQRHQVHSAPVAAFAVAVQRRRRIQPSSPCRTRDRASRRSCCRTSSIASGRGTARARATRAGSVSGLTLVREIVSLHGGTVSASSDGLGRGATFTVRLPAAQRWAGANGGHGSSPGDMRSGGASTPTLGGLSILVVDDELDARTIVAETLRLEGAEVTVSDSAARALPTSAGRGRSLRHRGHGHRHARRGWLFAGAQVALAAERAAHARDRGDRLCLQE